MQVIVNTNRIIAALIKDSYSRKVILRSKLDFITLDFTLREIDKYKQNIIKKAKISEEVFYKMLKLLLGRISIIKDEYVSLEAYKEAQNIMDKIDPSDTPFIALALSIKNDGIWSDDNHFQKQNRIKVWKTKDLIKSLSK